MGLLPERPGVHDVGRERFVGLVLGRGKVQRYVGLLEGGNLVVAFVSGIGLVFGSVDEVEVETVLSFADHHGFPGQGDFWVGGVGEVGHEYALPHGGALRGFYVLYVQNLLGKSFIKNSRLNFERNLRTFEAVFEVS